MMSRVKEIRGSLTPQVTEMLESMVDTEDEINNPSHYNAGNIETIDYIIDVLGPFEAINYCHGNVLKYTGTRFWNKGDAITNAEKAIWYLKKMVDLLKETEGTNW